MSGETISVASHLARVPFLAGHDPSSITRLAGLTNLNHLVAVDGERYVVRIPGPGTAEYIDRRAEAFAARSAAAAGVNADVLFFDESDGLMVTRFVDDALTMTPELFTDTARVERAADVLRALHRDADLFAVDFRLFPMIDEYKALLAAKRARLPEGYEVVQRDAEAARLALEANPVVLVPSHCDPLCENFLDTGRRMYLIDYEYSGNNDPMWDLGDLAVEGEFTAEQEAVLLRSYFGGEPPRDQVGRMVVYKAMCDLLWTLWGVIQHVNDNPVDDFWAYAVNRFERCRTLMTSPEFAEHVDAIGAR